MEPNKTETTTTTQSKPFTFDCFSTNIWQIFAKTNLFALCCIAAFLSLVTYLGAFSCEVSWILESHGDLPIYAYLLCSGYFIMFVASTILIHGLATGLSWGLFSWSVMVGILSIPELIFVMIMTTQYWGLQSIHGMTEIISYLVRLVINCMALLCVIPTGLRWRRERQIMSQLENLANRMHMSAAHTAAISSPLSPAAASAALSRINDSMRRKSASRNRRLSQCSGFDNPAFIPITSPQQNGNGSKHQPHITLPIFPYMYTTSVYPSQNEFNASIFGLDPSQLIHPMPPMMASKRTQSLLDFRHIIPATMPPHMTSKKPSMSDVDQTDSSLNQSLNNNRNASKERKSEAKRASRQNTLNKNTNKFDDEKQSQMGDPIYQTISSEKGSAKALGRNCISLENLRTLTIKNDLNNYGNNLLQNASNELMCSSGGAGGAPMSSGYYILPTFPPPPPTRNFAVYPTDIPGYAAKFMFAPPPHPAAMHHPHARMPPQYYPPNYHRMPPQFTNYAGYPNPNPYMNVSNTNSRQSIGNESDDYRKYRDVAL